MLYPINADGSDNPLVRQVMDSDLFPSLPAAAADDTYGIATMVTDYVTAVHWLDEFETTVLAGLPSTDG